MRIVIVAHGLRTGGGISVGQNIIAALGRLAPEHHYLVTIPPNRNYEQICAQLPHCELSVFSGGSHLIQRYRYETRELPDLIKRFHADVALCLGNIALQGVEIPQALLLHNPSYVYPPLHFGRTASWRLQLQVAVQRWQFARDLRRIRLLLCQTVAMEKRVRTVYGYQGSVSICPNAVSRFTVTGTDSQSMLPTSLARVTNKRRLLYLAAYYPHKNLEILIDLFREKSAALQDYVVIITISPEQGVGAAKLLKEIQKYSLDDAVVNVGPLPQTALIHYFNHCHALFMPTLLESFSGTYLEAMHFGLPILTSDFDFAHEVCGNAARYFNPHDLNSMVSAIHDVERLGNDLIIQGKIRLTEMFRDWDQVGGDMLSALERIKT